MKNSILSVAFLLLCSFIPSVSNAQMVGHLNFQEIIQLMPEYETASKEYDLYKLSLEDQLKQIETEYLTYQKKMDEESKKPAPSQTKLKIYAQQMELMQQNYQEMQQTVQDSLNIKMGELVEPIKTKVTDAVAEIAKEKGYSHIIDNSLGTLIYADPKNDISAAVKTKLGIKEKPAVNPGAGKPKTGAGN